MARPSRDELVKRFFPELGSTGTGGETEAAIEINTRACEAVLADMIKLCDEFREERGDGVLVLKLADGDRQSHYVTLADFCEDLTLAERAGDARSSALLRDTIRSIKTNDYSARVLIALVDKSRISVLPIPREYPAKHIQELQEQLTV